MRYRKTIAAFILISLVGRPSYPSGIPVVDFAALGEQMLHYITMISQYSTQVEQYSVQAQHYSTQLRQLENDYRNMQRLDHAANLNGLDEMQGVMNSAVGISSDAARMQTRFETLYPDFARYQDQSGASFSRQAAEWSKQNQQSALDTLRVQAAIKANIEADSVELKTLSARSGSASGTKDLLQVANQLLVLQTKQLMQLQQLLSSMAKADSAYMAERASKEAAAGARNQKSAEKWYTKGTKTVRPSLDRLH